jgi:hypothetical protein
MSRDKFLFAHSARLYQQAEALAGFLLDTFVDDEGPFDETRAVLAKAGALRLGDAPARKRAADLAWKHLVAVGGALDARFVLPALMEAIEQYYYGDDRAKQSVPWLGTAMKTAAAVSWANRGQVAASMKAHAQVRRLVAAAGAWEQLSLWDDQARAMMLGAAEFIAGGIRLESDEDLADRRAWNASTLKRGQAHRTLDDGRKVIWTSPRLFMEAVSTVLEGEAPSRIGLFQGTVFEAIESLPEFWLGLSARLKLREHAAEFRSQGRGERMTGISIFEPFSFRTSLFGGDAEKANAVSRAMFWQGDWHARRMAERNYPSNLLVERPAIRIDDRTFVVGLAHVGDSINCFVEHSVFRCFGYAGVPVSEEAFRRHVSQPFEDRVAACFAGQGWKVDHVSENGAWAGMTLAHPSGEPIPGEVDVLALHPGGRIAALAECKVLVQPFSSGKLLNVAQKLGPVDSEGFHRKLQEKAQWLKATPAFREVDLQPLLVVDGNAFLGRQGAHRVVGVDELPKIIEAAPA